MFESGIGPGVRSNRFGTWSLITFLLLFVTPAFHEALLFWGPALLACAATTLGALGCGLIGLFIRGQRQPAVFGLLKAALPTLAACGFVLLLIALSSMNFE